MDALRADCGAPRASFICPPWGSGAFSVARLTDPRFWPLIGAGLSMKRFGGRGPPKNGH